jgi:hypothetical protein
MGRPKGSKDLIKRSKRNQYGFSMNDAQIIKQLKNQHLSNQDIVNITELSHTQVKTICKKFNIKTIDTVILSSKKLITLNTMDCDCGVYILALHRKDGYVGYYVGSSVNIANRYKSHYTALCNGKHCNKKMQKDFMKMKAIRCYVWSLEEEKNLLKKESELINEYYGLYNTWRNINISEIIETLNIASQRFTEDKYDIQESGCWFWKRVGKNGYGKELSVSYNGKTSFLKPHRVSMFKYKGIYPELVRHKCNNRNCVCPDHLEGGSYRDNNNDKNKVLSVKIE